MIHPIVLWSLIDKLVIGSRPEDYSGQSWKRIDIMRDRRTAVFLKGGMNPIVCRISFSRDLRPGQFMIDERRGGSW